MIVKENASSRRSPRKGSPARATTQTARKRTEAASPHPESNVMAASVAPEFERFVNEERRARRLSAPSGRLTEGKLIRPIVVVQGRAPELLRVAARRASGLTYPSKHAEVVWAQGESELAVNLLDLDVKLSAGLIRVLIPVRCDQTGLATIEVVFAVGAPGAPAGLYASAFRRPIGPPLIVDGWGEALVAFAWQCVLGMITGVAGATGKDARGNVLVPVEMTASDKGIEIVPMARHRFAGGSGLGAAKTRGGQ